MFASCTDHSPESIAHFERQLCDAGFQTRVVEPWELRPGFGDDGAGGGKGEREGEATSSFRVLEMRRVRRGTAWKR